MAKEGQRPRRTKVEVGSPTSETPSPSGNQASFAAAIRIDRNAGLIFHAISIFRYYMLQYKTKLTRFYHIE